MSVQTPNPSETSLSVVEYLARRLDAARDLYLLALGMGERGPHEFGTLIHEARLHFIAVIEEARVAGLETIDIQNFLADHNIEMLDTVRPELRERLEDLLREYTNPR